MCDSYDEDWELDEAAKPYLEPLMRAMERAAGNSERISVSSNGLSVTIELLGGPLVLELCVLVVVEQGIYEFEYAGPEIHESGALPLNDEQSIDRLEVIAKEVIAMNIAANLRGSDGPDILATLCQTIREFTELGPPCPSFHRYVDVDGLDKLCCYVDRVDGGGVEYELIFFVEDENLVAQHVHHIWDPVANSWRGEPDQWREELWLFSPTLHQDATECLRKIWRSMGLL